MRGQGQQRLVTPAALALIGAAAVLAALDSDPRVLEPLTVVLAAGAIAANLAAVQYGATVWVSAAFSCAMLAVALLGPAGAFVVVLAAELGAWAIDRIRFQALAMNTAASTFPTVLAAWLFTALAGSEAGDLRLALALVVSATGMLILNFTIMPTLLALESGARVVDFLRPPLELFLPLGWTVAFVVATVLIYEHTEPLAGGMVILVLVGLTLMLRLLVRLRSRTNQYTELSVGAVAALLRALERTDPHAARHAAATGAFARDIAHRAGLSPHDCELAYAAGLLHDIGRPALHERGRRLTREDWRAIAQHPAAGAEIIAELDLPADVAHAVAAHHERVDGRGYPAGRRGEDIPVLARIVAVAEAYDTLTGGHTYRPPVSSFQAMVELRRVAGEQLDAKFVDALGEVLAGRALDYRHASEARLEGELALRRQIADVLAP